MWYLCTVIASKVSKATVGLQRTRLLLPLQMQPRMQPHSYTEPVIKSECQVLAKGATPFAAKPDKLDASPARSRVVLVNPEHTTRAVFNDDSEPSRMHASSGKAV
jgi:hypothetical protein